MEPSKLTLYLLNGLHSIATTIAVTAYIATATREGLYVGVFFFSSRRRHTRYWRDWSSDVCSSDLEGDELARRLVDLDKACPVGAQLLHQHPAGRPLDLDRARERAQRVGDADPKRVELCGAQARPRELELATDARDHLAGRERLDDVVVRPGEQPLDRGLLAGACGDEHDGHGAQCRVVAELAQEREPVEAGHHHVGQHEIRRCLAGAR